MTPSTTEADAEIRADESVAPYPRPEAEPTPALGPDSGFIRYLWFVLIYNLAAVAWGVFVRVSFSGDGCGSHWPLCDGDHTPMMGDVGRFVEMSHRGSTALIGLLVLIQMVWAYQLFPAKHLVRKASLGTLIMTLLEGGVGAALVKFELVTNNDSAVRAGVMAFHVISTFLLLGFLFTAIVAAMMPHSPKLRGQGPVLWLLGGGFVGIGLLGISGAISALGHQLHRASDVLAAATNPATHWMVKMQPLHPLIAVAVGLYLVLAAGMLIHLRPSPRVRQAVNWMLGLFGLQVLLGLANIVFKAPVPIQMTHLVLADINWLSLVAVGLLASARDVEMVEKRPAPAGWEVEPLRGRNLVSAYVALTKPRVISLLLFTCLAAMIAAEGTWPGLGLFLAVAVGGYMMAGAANAINMVIDRDIDIRMARTASRPTVTQSISSPNALLFAFALSFIAFAILWLAGGLLSATMAFSGLVFYVVVYTMLLKRRTWHNIVIGGAAGAFPPLVGWAAVTQSLPPLALVLFGIIFLWTPVHFWALALLIKDDYEAAGVPMLPVVKGDAETVRQILVYTIVTVGATLAPILMPGVGWIYFVGAALLNLVLIQMAVALKRLPERPQASRLFHYSMLYLALLFAVFAVDRAILVN